MSSCRWLQKLIAAFSYTRRGIDDSTESPLTMNLPCDNEISLWTLPDVVATNIFNRVGFKSILNLRKVCRDLRNRIDDIKPEANLCSVSIQVNNGRVLFTYHWRINEENLENNVEYFPAVERGKSLVICNGVEKIVNCEFMELAARDLDLIFTFQKKRMEKIEFTKKSGIDHFRIFLANFSVFRSFGKQLLKVGKFSIETNDQQTVIPALSLTDPESIEVISILGSNMQLSAIKFPKIIETEHWKTASTFETDYNFTGVSIQNFRHFSKIAVDFESISIDEVLEFKKIFQNSTEAKQFVIAYGTIVNREQFLEIMKPSAEINPVWFFRMSTTDEYVLRLSLLIADFFVFKRFPVADVPKDAEIQN